MKSEVSKWLVLLTWDDKVMGLNPTGDRIQLMTVRHFIGQILSLSTFYHLNMT